MKLATIQNRNGMAFNVRIVERGDSYGHKMGMVHNKEEPMVEFYDVRYRFDHDGGIILGQLISRYDLDTLRDLKDGLNLQGGVPDWKLDSVAVARFHAILKIWNL